MTGRADDRFSDASCVAVVALWAQELGEVGDRLLGNGTEESSRTELALLLTKKVLVPSGGTTLHLGTSHRTVVSGPTRQRPTHVLSGGTVVSSIARRCGLGET